MKIIKSTKKRVAKIELCKKPIHFTLYYVLEITSIVTFHS